MADSWGLGRPARERFVGRRASVPAGGPSLLPHPGPAAWKHVDLVLLVCVAAVSVLGALMVLSSTRGTDPDSYDTSFLGKQVLFIAIGAVGMVLVTLVDYRRLRDFAWLPYALTTVLLALVVSPLGSERAGHPGLVPDRVVPAPARRAGEGGGDPRRGLAAGAVRRAAEGAAAGVALLVARPADRPHHAAARPRHRAGVRRHHDGDAAGGGARPRHIVVLTAVGVVGVVGILNSDVLEDYQRDRLTVFLDRGAGRRPGRGLQPRPVEGRHRRRAASTARACSRAPRPAWGSCPSSTPTSSSPRWGRSSASSARPPCSACSRIMCVRIWRTAQLASDRLGMLICVGVLSMLVFQIFQNVGMTMGIMPITGITLPFMSYGGSSVIASWLAIGLVLNVHMRRFG